MHKADGFIALHMRDMQRMSRWRIFGELLCTFAVCTSCQRTCCACSLVFQRSLYCTTGASHAFVSGRTSDVGIAMLSADRLQMALSLWIHTYALPCRVVKQSHIFLLTFVGDSLACGYMYIATLDKNKLSILRHAKRCVIWQVKAFRKVS